MPTIVSPFRWRTWSGAPTASSIGGWRWLGMVFGMESTVALDGDRDAGRAAARGIWSSGLHVIRSPSSRGRVADPS